MSVRSTLWVLAPPEQGSERRHGGRAAEVVLALTDHDSQLDYVSADARPLGGPGRSLVGSPLLGLVHPSAAAEFLEAHARAVAHRIAVSIAVRLRSGATRGPIAIASSCRCATTIHRGSAWL